MATMFVDQRQRGSARCDAVGRHQQRRRQLDADSAAAVGLKLNAGRRLARCTYRDQYYDWRSGVVGAQRHCRHGQPGTRKPPSLAGTVLTASGVEGTAISLTITATPVDGDDVLSISVSGVPLDATLAAGTNNGGGNWTLTAAQLVGLKLNAGETRRRCT